MAKMYFLTQDIGDFFSGDFFEETEGGQIMHSRSKVILPPTSDVIPLLERHYSNKAEYYNERFDIIERKLNEIIKKL